MGGSSNTRHAAVRPAGRPTSTCRRQVSQPARRSRYRIARQRPRVLTYADLHTIAWSRSMRASQVGDRAASDRAHGALHVVVQRPEVLATPQPLRFRYGERLRIMLVNDTMMTHPIHLHGMWSELETTHGAFHGAQAHRHGMPAAAVSYASPRTRSDAGRTTAICSITWRRACSAKCTSRDWQRVRLLRMDACVCGGVGREPARDRGNHAFTFGIGASRDRDDRYAIDALAHG